MTEWLAYWRLRWLEFRLRRHQRRIYALALKSKNLAVGHHATFHRRVEELTGQQHDRDMAEALASISIEDAAKKATGVILDPGSQN